MYPNITRRSFIKGGVAAVGALGASRIPIPSSVKAFDKNELATLIDIRKCIGCEACVEACQEVNEIKFPEPEKPFPKMYPDRAKVEDWSEKRDVTDRLTPYNWLFIQESTVNINGEEETFTIPRRCMHCQHPPCVDLCPFGAAHKQENGISRIDPNTCLGGKKCTAVCPWKIPQRQTGVGVYLDILPGLVGNGVMFKCDRCYNRIDKGELPACIDICPENVQKIGPRDEIVREAHQIADEINGYIFGEHENGGTNTIYISPVPFKELNKGMDKGPGKPPMKKVGDSMANSENLAKAMFIAPFAGIAAGLLGFVKSSSNTKTGKETNHEG